jgi:hypothetical protein
VREHVRAALIALAILVHGVAASPLPKSAKRASFEQDIAKEELNRWVGILGAVGVDATPKELSDLVYQTSVALVDVRSTLLGPFRGWFRLTGTGQGWGLFTYPDSYPHQLTVAVRGVEQVWRPIYVALDPEYTWRRDVFVYRRVRGVYDGNTLRAGASYENFVRWTAREAFADFPEALQVRVGFYRFHTVRPDEPRDPERVEKHMRIIDRNAL